MSPNDRATYRTGPSATYTQSAADKALLEYAALAESYRRLRAAARGVIDAASYPADAEGEARIYRSQLATLERELKGEPQPDNKLTWMSVT